jgi:hypothetical protein
MAAKASAAKPLAGLLLAGLDFHHRVLLSHAHLIELILRPELAPTRSSPNECRGLADTFDVNYYRDGAYRLDCLYSERSARRERAQQYPRDGLLPTYYSI